MNKMSLLIFSILMMSLFLLGCGGSSTKSNVESVSIETVSSAVINNIDIPNNTLVNHYKILLIGNSHASMSLGELIKVMINKSKPESEIDIDRVEGLAYLSDRINDGITLEKIRSNQWSHIILQAQKYSQSGSTIYPTDAAQFWISTAKEMGATPILFPEHPQKGNKDEAQYIQNIHLSIIAKQKSCLAPIGLGWDSAINALPEIPFHSGDGNHAAYIGNFLSALIFYQVITNELADALPYIESIEISESIQSQLGEIASQILEKNQACKF